MGETADCRRAYALPILKLGRHRSLLHRPQCRDEELASSIFRQSTLVFCRFRNGRLVDYHGTC